MLGLFSKTTRKDYEESAKEYARTHINELNEKDVGKYIFCKAEEKNTSRLFINRFSVCNMEFKDGWWDTFTLSSKPIEHLGYYICKIDQFKIDKNGFLMMIVTPSKYLDHVNEESPVWKFFSMTGYFARNYDFSRHIYTRRFNAYHLCELHASGVVREQQNYLTKCAGVILEKLFKDEISINDIEEALDEKDPMEKLSEDLNKNILSYAAEYPLIVKKLPGAYTYDEERYFNTETTMSYLIKNMGNYYELNLKTAKGESVLDIVEAYLQHLEDKKAQEKADKKQKRLEKKAK